VFLHRAIPYSEVTCRILTHEKHVLISISNHSCKLPNTEFEVELQLIFSREILSVNLQSQIYSYDEDCRDIPQSLCPTQ